MLVSILHRATGDGMALVGTVLVVAWLACTAAGPDAYAGFIGLFTTNSGALNPIGYLFGIGLTLSLFQHIASGVRHLILDTGAGYELRANKRGAVATMIFSVLATIVFWAVILVGV